MTDRSLTQDHRPRLTLSSEGWPHTADLLLYAPEGRDLPSGTLSERLGAGGSRLAQGEPLLLGHWSLAALDLDDADDAAFAVQHRAVYDPRCPHRERVTAAVALCGGAAQLAVEAGLSPAAGQRVRVERHGREEIVALARRHRLAPRLLLGLAHVDELLADLGARPLSELRALLADAAQTLFPSSPADLYAGSGGPLYGTLFGEADARRVWEGERDGSLADLNLLTLLRVLYGARAEWPQKEPASIRFAALNQLDLLFGRTSDDDTEAGP